MQLKIHVESGVDILVLITQLANQNSNALVGMVAGWPRSSSQFIFRKNQSWLPMTTFSSHLKQEMQPKQLWFLINLTKLSYPFSLLWPWWTGSEPTFLSKLVLVGWDGSINKVVWLPVHLFIIAFLKNKYFFNCFQFLRHKNVCRRR